MSMMKLHWSPRSPFVRKVMVAAHELGVADRIQTTRTLVGFTIVAPQLLPDNPLNKIPTLVLEDGTVTGEQHLAQGIGRVRDVEVAGDGSIYLLVEDSGQLVRLTRQ